MNTSENYDVEQPPRDDRDEADDHERFAFTGILIAAAVTLVFVVAMSFLG
jgi:hypothetical protein